MPPRAASRPHGSRVIEIRRSRRLSAPDSLDARASLVPWTVSRGHRRSFLPALSQSCQSEPLDQLTLQGQIPSAAQPAEVDDDARSVLKAASEARGTWDHGPLRLRANSARLRRGRGAPSRIRTCDLRIRSRSPRETPTQSSLQLPRRSGHRQTGSWADSAPVCTRPRTIPAQFRRFGGHGSARAPRTAREWSPPNGVSWAAPRRSSPPSGSFGPTGSTPAARATARRPGSTTEWAIELGNALVGDGDEGEFVACGDLLAEQLHRVPGHVEHGVDLSSLQSG
jgi:hypothetical protein